jgi:uncharacterized protein YjbI with pentapeptide repeats
VAYYLASILIIGLLFTLLLASSFSLGFISLVTLMTAEGQQQPLSNATDTALSNAPATTNDSNTRIEDIQRIESLLQTIKCNSPIRPKVDLSYCDLSDVDLSNTNLQAADLHNAHFRDAILSSTNLIHANLSEAMLFSADLSNADLTGADLSNAYLIGADLSDIDLSCPALGTRAERPCVDLSNANLYRSFLPDADLDHADLSNANLTEANLSNADLSFADLSNATLIGAVVNGTNFGNATMTGCVGCPQ